MKGFKLLCREDPVTGMPRLEDAAGCLEPEDLRALEQELHRRFDQLVGSGDGRLFQLEQRHPRLPEFYRVTITKPGKRCPEMVLEPAEAVRAARPSAPAKPAPARADQAPGWQAQFIQEVKQLVGGSRTEATRFLLADLEDVHQRSPEKLTWILLAGYLHAGHAICRHHQVASPYEDAAAVLAESIGDQLPPGLLDVSQELGPPEGNGVKRGRARV